MERAFFTTIVTGLLGIVTAGGGLGFIWAAPKLPSSPAADSSWRLLEPISYENIAVFPVVSNSTQDTSGFLTLDEGLSRGEVLVTEQGSASMVRNRDDGRRYVPPVTTSGASVN